MYKSRTGTMRKSANEEFAQTLRRHNPVVDAENVDERDGIAGLGMSAFQQVSQSLEGPFGLHPPTLMAALGALAGYAAKWAVALDVADGLAEDDFHIQPGDGGRRVLFSNQVRELVAGLGRQSVLSIVLGAATRANAVSYETLAVYSRRLVLPGTVNAMPDYDVEPRWMPQIAPEALLMMLWENTGRSFRAERRARSDLALGLAYASAHAISVWRDSIPAETSAGLVMESALAMAKIDRAF